MLTSDFPKGLRLLFCVLAGLSYMNVLQFIWSRTFSITSWQNQRLAALSAPAQWLLMNWEPLIATLVLTLLCVSVFAAERLRATPGCE